MKYLFSLLTIIFLLVISFKVIAQDDSPNGLVAQNLSEVDNLESESLINMYFEDIYDARRKLIQVIDRVEHNYKNKLLDEKLYQKQISALNNMLLSLVFIEDRRLHLINKRRNK